MGRPKRPSLRMLRQEAGELLKNAAALHRQLESYDSALAELFDGDGDPAPAKKRGRSANQREHDRSRSHDPAKARRGPTTPMVGDETLSQWLHDQISTGGRPLVAESMAFEAGKQGARTKRKGGIAACIKQVISRSSRLEWVDEDKTRFRQKEE